MCLDTNRAAAWISCGLDGALGEEQMLTLLYGKPRLRTARPRMCQQ